jgi:type II secretory pathway pseudopilin PulG
MSSRRQRRHHAQAGTTLIELLVSVMIIGLVVVMVVGAFSTGLLDATLAKRTTAVAAAQAYEVEKIAAAGFSAVPAPYSECFAIDTAAKPTQVALGGSCGPGMDLRADVTGSVVQPCSQPANNCPQQWDVRVVSYPSLATIGTTVSVYKGNR